MKKFSVTVLFIFSAVFLSSSPGFAQIKHGLRTAGNPRWVPNEIVVKFKQGVSEEAIAKVNRDHGASILSVSRHGRFRRLRVPRRMSIEQMAAAYRKNPNVEYAEPNYIATALMVPNDTYYSYQWNMDNRVYGGIHMESAWDVGAGDPSVIVAIIDTGVAYENYGSTYLQAPDLAGVHFVAGYDFVNNDSHPNDDEGHGTHVTGTIAQATNNGLGVAGIAFNCSIMPVKVLDSTGMGTYANIANGIYFAADNGASVINLSLGGSSASTTLEQALAYAHNHGVTIVCAAGNEYQSGNHPLYPAAYNAYCIAVGATRYDETRAYYSNTGSYVDIAAPGGDLSVDQNRDGYGDGILQQTFGRSPQNFGYYFYSGTSMATPHVAGVAALLISNGVIGPDNVRLALESTAKDKGTPGWDSEYGWGLLDAAAALAFTASPEHDVAISAIDAPAVALQGDTAAVDVVAANMGDFEEVVTIRVEDVTDSSVIGSETVNLTAGGTATLQFDWDTGEASIGDHTLEATVEPVSGETNMDNNSKQAVVSVQPLIHDVAIAAMDAPSTAIVGNVVPVAVTAANEGSLSETVSVSLTDATSSVLLGTQQVLITPGDTQVLNFSWDTAGAATGDHVLAAEAEPVLGEIDTTDNLATIDVALSQLPALHVQQIQMSALGRWFFKAAQADVLILDETGNTVSGAVVTGEWALNGNYLGTTSAKTNKAGWASIRSPILRIREGTFTFTVTDVAKSGLIYDPASNTETTGTISVP
jgi:serine protease